MVVVARMFRFSLQAHSQLRLWAFHSLIWHHHLAQEDLYPLTRLLRLHVGHRKSLNKCLCLCLCVQIIHLNNIVVPCHLIFSRLQVSSSDQANQLTLLMIWRRLMPPQILAAATTTTATTTVTTTTMKTVPRSASLCCSYLLMRLAFINSGSTAVRGAATRREPCGREMKDVLKLRQSFFLFLKKTADAVDCSLGDMSNLGKQEHRSELCNDRFPCSSVDRDRCL